MCAIYDNRWVIFDLVETKQLVQASAWNDLSFKHIRKWILAPDCVGLLATQNLISLLNHKTRCNLRCLFKCFGDGAVFGNRELNRFFYFLFVEVAREDIVHVDG